MIETKPDTLDEQEAADQAAEAIPATAADAEGGEVVDAEFVEDPTAAAPFNAEEMTADTMLGDMVRMVIDEIKAAPDVWPKLSEYKQDDVIRRVTKQCTELVKMAVHLIAADGREVISADLEQITAKDEIKAVLKLVRHDPQRHALLDAVGKPVLIVVAGAAQFMGGEIPKAEADNKPLFPADSTAPAPDATTTESDTPVADNCPATAAQE